MTAVPGAVSGIPGGSITRAVVVLEDMSAVGDGDPDRTTVDMLTLAWPGELPRITFSNPPLSIYSSWQGRIRSYEITGTVDISDVQTQFVIQDQPPGIVSVEVNLIGVRVDFGKNEVIDIGFDPAALMGTIDWAGIDDDDGGPIMLMGDELDPIRLELANSFQLL